MKSLAVDAPIGREVTPMTEPPVETALLKIKIRRGGEAPSSQPVPLVTVVNTFPINLRVQLANAQWKAPFQSISTLKEPEPIARTAAAASDLGSVTSVLGDSDLEEILCSPPRRPKAIVPQLEYSNHPPWFERHRKHIEDRGGPIDEPFTGVSEALLRSLEDTEKTGGGSKRILSKVKDIAHKAFVQQMANVLKGDNDTDPAQEVGQHDGSGEELSQDLLECTRRVMLIEARVQDRSISHCDAGALGQIGEGDISLNLEDGDLSEDSDLSEDGDFRDLEDEPAKEEGRRGEKRAAGNV